MPPNFPREALDSAGTRSGTFCESCGSLRIGSSGRVKSLSCFGMMMLALGTAQVWRNGDLYHDFAGMKQAENMDVRIVGCHGVLAPRTTVLLGCCWHKG